MNGTAALRRTFDQVDSMKPESGLMQILKRGSADVYE
jgi:hypothetical protein